MSEEDLVIVKEGCSTSNRRRIRLLNRLTPNKQHVTLLHEQILLKSLTRC